MINRIFISVILLLPLTSFSQKAADKIMKETGDKLLSYLSNNDTAAIIKLHFDDEERSPTEKEYREGIKRLLDDCKAFQKITRKYGTPKRNAYNIKEGINGNKELEIMLFDKKDTILNLVYCKVVIVFYPVSIMDPVLILGYRIEEGIERPKNQIIRTAPGIKNN